MERPDVLFLELAIVTVLIVINGLLSMSELAIVSSRPARLAALVEKGIRGSRRALALASDPGKFLSTVRRSASACRNGCWNSVCRRALPMPLASASSSLSSPMHR
jgi:CBS domain containing-hemolysin-like protein